MLFLLFQYNKKMYLLHEHEWNFNHHERLHTTKTPGIEGLGLQCCVIGCIPPPLYIDRMPVPHSRQAYIVFPAVMYDCITQLRHTNHQSFSIFISIESPYQLG